MEESKKPAKTDARRARLAAQLRANLSRRRGQAQARKDRPEPPDDKRPKR